MIDTLPASGNPAETALPFAGVRLLRHPDWNTLEFAAPWPVLSSAPVGGGDVTADRIVNLCVDGPDVRAHCDDPWACFDHLAAAHGWRGRTVGLMTGVRAQRLGTALHRIGNTAWLALATVGTSNAHRAGRQPVPSAGAGAGTINLIAFTPQRLAAAARTEALMLATEARCAALADHGIESVNNQGPATGTGTDAIAIACAPGGETPWTGYHTDSGYCLARAVQHAIALSLDGGGTSV